jgi:hypothetical protein
MLPLLASVTLKMATIVVGCIAFHFHLGPVHAGGIFVDLNNATHFGSSAALNVTAANSTASGSAGLILEYSMLRSWGQMVLYRNNEWLVVLLRTPLQVWAALHAGRWFVELMLALTDRLYELHLDIDDHHAADLDDMFFGAATALILAGTYASSSMVHTHGRGGHKLDDGRHSFSLLAMLGGLTICLAGSAALHLAIDWVRRLIESVEQDVITAASVVDDHPNDNPVPTGKVVFYGRPVPSTRSHQKV